MWPRTICCAIFVTISAFAARARADELKSAPLKEPPPAEVVQKVRDVLQAEGLRVTAKGKPFVDVWLRKSVPTRADPQRLGVDFGSLPEGSLLGAVRFHERSRDFRGNRFAPGVYTFRYVVQPEDGDHLGVSETRDFNVLCPAKDDVEPEAMPAKKIVELSLKVSGKKHPSILYLMKMFDEAESYPRLVEDAEREYWILDCRIPSAESGAKAVRLGLVLVGEADEI